jgi:hypothetical protein
VKEYNAMVEMIRKIERSSSASVIPNTENSALESSIDLNSIITGPSANRTPKKYKDLIAATSRVEKRQTGMRFEKQERAVVQKQPVIENKKSVAEKTQSAALHYQIGMPHISFPASEKIRGELSDVEKSIASINLQKREPKEANPGEYKKLKTVAISKRIMKNAVLPNLSVSDQVSELEKIIEGIKEGVFDKAHIDIIKREVKDLNDILKIERMENPNVQEDPMEGLRDLRLSDVMALLSGDGAD